MSRTVRCRARWFRGTDQVITFAITDYDIRLHDRVRLGPRGLVPVAADLVELMGAVYWIERRLLRRREAPIELELEFPVRQFDAWSDDVLAALADTLRLMGGATWSITGVERSAKKTVPPSEVDDSEVEQVALFSGGLDSTSGVATLPADGTRLVSFYSRQRTLQEALGRSLGHAPPVQFWLKRHVQAKQPGRTFRYRSLFFLCLAAAAASSWGARRVVQFENGVLATAVPPSPAWLMTKHCHPDVHQKASRFLSLLFDEEWEIDNPFLPLTKRECVDEARQAFGPDFDACAHETESCWHLYSNRIPGASKKYPGNKKPGLQCGVCIPCLVRRTALLDERFARDMTKTRWKNHDRFGRDFRAYYMFLDRVIRAETSSEFYRILPVPGRDLMVDDALGTDAVDRLFRTFAAEFMETFGR